MFSMTTQLTQQALESKLGDAIEYFDEDGEKCSLPAMLLHDPNAATGVAKTLYIVSYDKEFASKARQLLETVEGQAKIAKNALESSRNKANMKDLTLSFELFFADGKVAYKQYVVAKAEPAGPAGPGSFFSVPRVIQQSNGYLATGQY